MFLIEPPLAGVIHFVVCVGIINNKVNIKLL